MKLFLLVLFCVSNLVFAQNPTPKDVRVQDPRNDKNHACAPDFKQFCTEEVPSDKNYWGCLGLHMNELTPKCYDFMKAVYKRLYVCGTDILSNCNGFEQNLGRSNSCLMKKRGLLSAKCEETLNGMEKKKDTLKKVNKLCEKEIQKHCTSPHSLKCLDKITKVLPESDLSADCKIGKAILDSEF